MVPSKRLTAKAHWLLLSWQADVYLVLEMKIQAYCADSTSFWPYLVLSLSFLASSCEFVEAEILPEASLTSGDKPSRNQIDSFGIFFPEQYVACVGYIDPAHML